MVILVTVIHIVVSLFLIVVVLLQSGKAADLAGAFGGQGSQTVFGPRGSATVLTRATTISAVVFMVTSLALSIVSTKESSGRPSVLEENVAPAGSTETTGGDANKAAQPGTPGSIQITPAIEGQPTGPAQTIPIPPPGQTEAPAPQK